MSSWVFFIGSFKPYINSPSVCSRICLLCRLTSCIFPARQACTFCFLSLTQHVGRRDKFSIVYRCVPEAVECLRWDVQTLTGVMLECEALKMISWVICQNLCSCVLQQGRSRIDLHLFSSPSLLSFVPRPRIGVKTELKWHRLKDGEGKKKAPNSLF